MPPQPTQALTILVVEDDEDTRDFFVLLLMDAGYEVRAAGSGRGGLDQLADGPVDAAMLDLRLPDMNGLTLSRLIHERMPRIPIMLVTADDLDQHWMRAARTAGVTDILPKPFWPQTLLDRLAALFTASDI